MSTPTIRPERSDDAAPIRRLVEVAFAGAPHTSGTEGAIVDALRAAGTLTLSLVAEDRVDGGGDAIVGHIAFSPVTIAGTDAGWFGLGPLAVLPGRQGTGVGAALVRDGLARLRETGARGCVVLGDPDYYRRFGFTPDPDLTFAGAPPAYFMRRTFSDDVPTGPVRYADAFYDD